MRYCLLILTIISFCACKKTIDTDNVTTPSSIPDNIRLQRIIWVDSTFAAPADTGSITSFVYDADGRCITINQVDNQYTGNKPGYRTYKYSYSGSGTLPIKKTERTTGGNTPPGIYINNDTTWYVYDAQQRKIADSSVSWQTINGVQNSWGHLRTQHFRYKNDTLFAAYAKAYTDDHNPYDNDLDTLISNAAGLIIKQLVHNTTTGSSPFLPIVSYEYKYSDKINPLSRLSISKVFNNAPDWAYELFVENLLQSQANVIIEKKENYRNGSSRIVTTYDRYNSYGLLTGITYFHNLSYLKFRTYLLEYNN